MPKEKQKLYAYIELGDTVTTKKYYRIEARINNKDKENLLMEFNNASVDNDITENIIEISKDQFLFEVQNNLDKLFISSLTDSDINLTASNTDSDDIVTSWVEMTTTLTKLNVSSGDCLLTNDVTYIKSNGLLQPITTHIIGLGSNSNYSIVKDSEYLVHTYDLYSSSLGIYEPDVSDYYMDAYKKSTSGYAFVINITDTQISNTMIMGVRITPNVSNTTVIDGYGHYAKYTKSVIPSISFSSGGASIDITLTENKIEAPNTHVQLRR